MEKKLIIVRGGGDIATGTIHRLWSAGLPVLVLEAEYPSAIRRQVAVSEAVYDGETVVEEPPTCPFCKEEVKEGATRCPHCAAELPQAAVPVKKTVAEA